jgi:hypothetical protein
MSRKERTKPPPYTCPSCGWETRFKNGMRKHLYVNKKPCASTTGISLTDALKSHIMENRVYIQVHVQTDVKSTVNIYNFHQVNNILNNIPFNDKLTRYMDYQKADLIDYQTKVQDLFEEKTDKMEFCTVYDDVMFELREDDFLEIIDKTCCVHMTSSFEDFNIFYNSDLDYITLFDNGEWRNLLHHKGIREMILIIQAAYFNVYEKYLVRRVKYSTSPRLKQHCEELLKEYYKFISIFDIDPYIKDKCDDDIFDNGKYDSFADSEKFYDIYQSLKKTLRVSQQRYLITSILKIVHKHSKMNLSKLNLKLSTAIKDDNGLLAHLTG